MRKSDLTPSEKRLDITAAMDSRILPRAAGLVAAALLGAAIALGGAAVVGMGGQTTTVREVASPPANASPAFQGGALSINEIYTRSAPGVVQVTSTAIVENEPDLFFGNPFAPGSQEERSLGSGFVIDKRGHIITNFHVVEDAQAVEVSFSNRETMKARIVGSDPSTDTAVLKVDARARALRPLTLGDSDAVQVGDSVVAIGNPFGYERSITAGIVSALQREITAPNLFAIDHVIQTDAPINQGNSGGPLINAQGQVIGVNTAIETGGTGEGGNVGIGFAIPINTVKDVAAQLIRDGKVEHPFLGVGVKPIDRRIARLFKLPVERGLLVQDVSEGSGAAAAGLKPGSTEVVVAGESWLLGGDLIVSVDDVAVDSEGRLRDAITSKRPGDTIELDIYRDERKLTIEVKLGRRPSSPQS
jgi:S1-C subfamily serine protease